MNKQNGTATAVPTSKQRKPRQTKPKHYKVCISGDIPMLVIAKTQQEVLAHVASISVATDSDLIDAGRDGWSIVDLTGSTPQVEKPSPLSFSSSAATA